MEDLPPLEEDFIPIKRSVLLLRHKQPFYDWLAGIDPTDTNMAPLEEDAYLLPPFQSKQELEKFLKKNFDRYFTIELNDWYLDEPMWPRKRTWKMFGEWFDYRISSVVRDTCEDLPLEEEEEPNIFGEGGMYDDDGNPVDLSKVPIPAKCLLCHSFKSTDPEEILLCNLNRFDQQNEETFECEAFDPDHEN